MHLPFRRFAKVIGSSVIVTGFLAASLMPAAAAGEPAPSWRQLTYAPMKDKKTAQRFVRVTIVGGVRSGSYQIGAKIKIFARAPAKGRRFDRWDGPVSDPFSPNTTLTVPSAPVTVTAVYADASIQKDAGSPEEVAVQIENGSGSGSYRPGATITVSAMQAPAGMTFGGWTGDTAGLADPTAPTTTYVVPTRPARLVGTYAPAPAGEVDVVVSGGSGSGRYKPGAVVTLYAFAGPAGQVFDKWIGPVASPGDPITSLTVPAANVTVTAAYKAGAAADIVLTVKGGSGSGSYKPGTTVRVTANQAPAGKVFRGWVGEASAISAPNAPSADFRLGDRDASVEATFGDPIFNLVSHQDGANISNQGETMFGQIEAAKLDQIDRLAVTIGQDERIIDVSKTGMFAFRVFREMITPGQPVEVTVTAYLTDSTSSAYTYRFAPIQASGAMQQILGRLTYGATPALLAELKTKSFSEYIRQQLNPDDNDANELNLKTNYIDPFWNEINVSESFATESVDGLRLAYAASTKWQLREVMTRFWDNHFHTSIVEAFHKEKQRNIDAYRANAFGNFKDLLSISANSALMMTYLTNSVNSDKAINENYGRELLELHSVGIDGGYTPEDIRMVARIMAGRSAQRVTRTFNNTSVAEYIFNFDASKHADNVIFSLPFIQADFKIGPRPRAQGMLDGEDLIAALAKHPSTQRFVCGKLVEYLVSDDRPQEFIDLCTATWTKTDGNIKSILEVMLTDSRYINTASYQRSKIKTPFEYAVGVLRNYPFGFKMGRALPALKSMLDIWVNAGMDMLLFPVPTGFKEKVADWNSPASLIARFSAATDKINGPNWPATNAAQNFAGLLTTGSTPMVTAQAAAAYLLALGTADRFDRDEFDAVVAALKGSDGVFDPTVMANGVSVEEPAVRKAISLILTLPSYQIQ